MNARSLVCLTLFGLAACGGSDASSAVVEPGPAAPAGTVASGPGTVQSPTEPPPAPKADDPGPPPPGCGTLAKDQDGFFTRSSGKGSYVGFVPKGYTGQPTRLLVGLHGCGDDAANFARWGINPYDTRKDQDYIGIAIDGASGGGGCWDLSKDVEKVNAAIADVSKCVYVHQQKVVLAGFSSGGSLGYSMAMTDASHFAGLLISNSSLSSAGNPDKLLAGAARKIDIAHRAHLQDGVFPIAKVRADWAKIKAAGFPLQTSEVAGDHDGTSEDWSQWLIGKMTNWKTP